MSKQRTVEQIKMFPGSLTFFSPRGARIRRIDGRTFWRYASSPVKKEAQELADTIRMRWPERRRYLVRVTTDTSHTYKGYDVWIADR